MNLIIIYIHIYILIWSIHINSIEVPCASICTTLVVATIWILSQGSTAVFCRMIIQWIASKMRPAVQQPRIPMDTKQPLLARTSLKALHKLSPPQMRYLEALEHPANFILTPLQVWSASCSEHEPNHQNSNSSSPSTACLIPCWAFPIDCLLKWKLKINQWFGTWKACAAPRARHLLAVSLQGPLHRRPVLRVTRWPLIDWSICFPGLGISEHSLPSTPMVYQHFIAFPHIIAISWGISSNMIHHFQDFLDTMAWMRSPRLHEALGQQEKLCQVVKALFDLRKLLIRLGKDVISGFFQHEILSNRVGAENSNQCIPVYGANGTSIDGIRGNKDYDVGLSKIQWNTGIPPKKGPSNNGTPDFSSWNHGICAIVPSTFSRASPLLNWLRSLRLLLV